ncbi:MAG: matrixin family metalloprotease [Planctomycetes bacterium]|nr:matrixin family metalloprotease [Planctomycetota bacterium]
MKWNHLLVALGAGAAAWLVRPPTSAGYTLLGGTLDLGQRDYRFFNNFPHPTANSNTIPDPDFPGALGAELAVWKGASEWNSRLHGTGGVDLWQPDGIGSGGSNFDSFYVGLATDPGGVDDNIASMFPGISGIHAFTEVPIQDGWRIRFMEGPDDWQDQPDPTLWTGAHPWDIQGTMTHEYGHALGLGHTNVPGATMGSPLNLGVGLRSIEADDIAGLQFLYGVVDPSKPVIETYTLAGNVVTLHGHGFDPSQNEVWLTQATPGGDGTPVRVLSVPSQAGGTELSFAFPSEAKAGQVAIKRPGSQNTDLSAPFPLDPNREPYFRQPRPYGTSKTSSAGLVPEIALSSVPSIGHGSFTIDVTGGPLFNLGIVLSGPNRDQRPFFGGRLWIGPPYVREQVFQFQVQNARVSVPIPAGVQPGDSRFYQVWFVDIGDPQGVGLTHGLWVTFSE